MNGQYAPQPSSSSSTRQRAATYSAGPRYSPASMAMSLSAGGAAPSGVKSTLNQRAALVSAYNELGKELASTKLKAVGNYTLGRSIGEGTFGKVRMGTHRLTGTRVALKQVPKAHSASLTREIHHHRRLHHSYVMKLYEVLATESNIWMVSELCLGGELYDYLVERGTLPEAEARRIFGQLCLAVAYIHGKGIVHRDLKLENVLLDERCNVKLGDFGFTREFEGKRLMETFCGTTGYAAPEMLAGKKYTGEEVDIWSLGIILYALLSGSLPFDDDDEAVMKSKILSGEYEMPPFLSEEARDLVSRILRLEPTQRLSLKAILSHPWFTKTIVATPMTTVDEDAVQGGYFQDSSSAAASPQISRTSSRAAQAAATPGEETITPANAAERLAGLGVDLGISSAASVGSVSSVSQSDDSSDPSESTTDPTSLDVSEKGDQGVMDKLGNPRAGMMHRNESQTTIRKDGSVGSDASVSRRQSLSSKATSARTLATHHEAGAGTLARPEAAALVRRGSQSSSRGHHRTPSRTKRRSLSSGGLSDHHPPYLTNRPIDYCALLEQQPPALFSTPLEQSLLHQLGSLGMDVGQIVHSILTDACDASAAMWWLLKSKVEERQETERFLAPSGITPSSSAGMAGAAPPIPPKDPLRARRRDSVPAEEGTDIERERASSSRASPVRVEGLPSTAQDSFRRHVQPPVDVASTPAKEPPAKPANPLASPSASSTAAPLPASPPPRTSFATSLEDDGRSNGSPRQDKAARPRPSRDRTNSLSVKLASVLSGSRKDNAPEVPKLSPDDEAGPEQRVVKPQNTSSMAGFFSRRPTGGVVSAKAGGDQRAVSQPLPAKGLTALTTDLGGTSPPPLPVSKSTTPIIESDGSALTSQSPSKSSSSAATKSSSSSSGGGGHIPNSLSVDTFTTVSSSSAGGGSESVRSGEGAGKKPSSSFFNTVRTWLGTEDKQARKQRNGKGGGKTRGASIDKGKGAGAGSGKAGLALSGHGHDASTGVHRTGSVRSRVGPYTTASSSTAVGPGSHLAPNTSPTATRRYPRTPSNRTLTAAHRLSGSGGLGGPSPIATLSLIDTHGSSFGRPSPLRRPSAGSITPTAMYGERPSRAPSSSSLYRPSGASGSVHKRAGSISSQHSGGAGSGFGRGGSDLMGSRGSSGFRASPLASRRMSSEGGTIVVRHRVRPRSEKSRPTSLIDVGEGSGIFGGGDDTLLGPSTTTTTSSTLLAGGSGLATPRRWSIDSRRDVDSIAGRSSPATATGTGTANTTPQQQSSSIFVAHRPRHHSYKPPSANPSLFTHSNHHQAQPSTSSSTSATGSIGGAGVWRRSWGRPPPSWTGPIDDGPSRAELARIAAVARATSAGRTSLRDVFSGRGRKKLQQQQRGDEEGSVGTAASEEWEDEDGDEDDDDEGGAGGDKEPVFSGGLGQLDSMSSSSNGHGHAASSSVSSTSSAGRGSLLELRNSSNKGTTNVGRGGYASSPRMPATAAPWSTRPGTGGSPSVTTNNGGGGRRSWLPQPGVTSSTSSAPANPFGKSTQTMSSTSRSAGAAVDHTSGLPSPSLPSPSLAAYQTPQLGRDTTPRMIAVSEDEEEEEEEEEEEDGTAVQDGEVTADSTVRGMPLLGVGQASNTASTSPVMGSSPNLPGSFIPPSTASQDTTLAGTADPTASGMVGLGLGQNLMPAEAEVATAGGVEGGGGAGRKMTRRATGGGGSPLPPAVEEEEEEDEED